MQRCSARGACAVRISLSSRLPDNPQPTNPHPTCRLLPPDECGRVAAHANDRKLAAKSVQDGSLRLYLCVMLHRQPLVCDAGARGSAVGSGCRPSRMHIRRCCECAPDSACQQRCLRPPARRLSLTPARLPLTLQSSCSWGAPASWMPTFLPWGATSASTPTSCSGAAPPPSTRAGRQTPSEMGMR